MPTDRLAAELRARFAPAELKTLHQHLVDALDDDAPPADPLGRLADAIHAAAYTQPATQPA